MNENHQKALKKIKWGIISTAKIAREKMIPAIQASNTSEVYAIASRSEKQAKSYALEADIPIAYSHYQQLLDDENIDIIYNPLPNHLHVPWSIKAIESGKHVLCEKPIGLDSSDVEKLREVAKKHPQLKVMEAFMYRFHPQWHKVKSLIAEGKIGKIHRIDAMFTYHNIDPANVRNQPNIGGGGLMDIGCYCISVARYLLDKEPLQVIGQLTMDEDFKVDKHAHALLDFDDVTASLYCSTQSEAGQRVYISGEQGSLTIEEPFYQDDYGDTNIVYQHNRTQETFVVKGENQYIKQVDALAQAINNNQATPTALEDALANMNVIEAIFSSHKNNQWVKVNSLEK